jgi:hypothetical protein
MRERGSKGKLFKFTLALSASRGSYVWGHFVDHERVHLPLEIFDTLPEIKRVHPTISFLQAEGVVEIYSFHCIDARR